MSTDKEPCGECGLLAVNDDYSERCSSCGWLLHYPTCYKRHECHKSNSSGVKDSSSAKGIANEANRVAEGMSSSMYQSCFLSYSTADQDFAKRLHEDLETRGIRCWFAPKDIKIGDRIRTSIDGGIRSRERLLLVLSADSVASSWVEKEVETAFQEEQRRGVPVLFPIRLDDAVFSIEVGWVADIGRSRHVGDFREWKTSTGYATALARLLRDLRESDAAQPAVAAAGATPRR